MIKVPVHYNTKDKTIFDRDYRAIARPWKLRDDRDEAVDAVGKAIADSINAKYADLHEQIDIRTELENLRKENAELRKKVEKQAKWK